MPLTSRWETFGQCVGAQKRLGHSDISARKICGTIQAKTEGSSISSPDAMGAAGPPMSQEMNKEEEGAGGSVTFSPKEIAELTQAAMDGNMEAVLAILEKKVEIQTEAEPEAEKAKPPFAR